MNIEKSSETEEKRTRNKKKKSLAYDAIISIRYFQPEHISQASGLLIAQAMTFELKIS